MSPVILYNLLFFSIKADKKLQIWTEVNIFAPDLDKQYKV